MLIRKKNQVEAKLSEKQEEKKTNRKLLLKYS